MNTKALSTIITIMLTLVMFSSCSKDDTIKGDEDTKGSFELQIDGQAQKGSEVINVTAFGVRTISAENNQISFQLLIDESKFVAGTSFNIDTDNLDPMLTMDANNDQTEEVYWGLSGSIKVISKTKIEIDANFHENWLSTNPAVKVKGFISSK